MWASTAVPDGKLHGDGLNFAEAAERPLTHHPVPGGVGPMTAPCSCAPDTVEAAGGRHTLANFPEKLSINGLMSNLAIAAPRMGYVQTAPHPALQGHLPPEGKGNSKILTFPPENP